MEENKDKNRKPMVPGDQYQMRAWIIWIVIIMAIFGLYSFYPQKQPDKWDMKKVIEALDSGRIKEGTIKADRSEGENWYTISLKIKNPEFSGKEQEKNVVSPVESVTGKSEQGVEQKTPETFDAFARGRLGDEDYRKLQMSGLFKEEQSSNLWRDMLIGSLPILLLFALGYFLFFRYLRNANKGAFSFIKSRAKLVDGEKEKITFADVAGCEESKEEVSEIVDFLKNPRRYQKMGARVPKGILMVGPPGTGKTLLARAVAGEANVPFFSISGSDFVEMFVGVGAARVRDMFDQARKSAPCIVFIDEIDAVGRQRGAGLGGGNDEREQTLNSILVEMDGFDSETGVIIIAATNRPDVLDKALLRPGRFDRQVMIPLPDVKGREAILRVHARKKRLASNVDFDLLARNTAGCSGADLANMLNEAALIAARHQKKEIDNFDIEEAREKVFYGRERRRLMDDEDRKITAWHEAGHALVQALLGDDEMAIHKVTILPRGSSLGSTMFVPKKEILNYSQRRVLNQICMAMGGRVAEEIQFSDITSGAYGDIRMATKMARHMVCDWGMSPLGPVAYGENQEELFLGREITRTQNYSEETAREIDTYIKKIVEEQYERAKSLMLSRKDALDKIAEALLKYETIEGRHVLEIVEHGDIQSTVGDQNRMSDRAVDSVGSEQGTDLPLDSANPVPSIS